MIFFLLFLATTALATDSHHHHHLRRPPPNLRSPPKQRAVLLKDDSHQAAISINSSLRKAVTGLKPYNTLQQQRELKQCEPGWYGVNCSQFIGGNYDYTLQVTLPLPGSTVTEEEVAIQGTISPADEGVFTILCEVFSSSTVYVTLSEISSSGEFTVYVTLSEGINILEITAFSPTAEVLASTHMFLTYQPPSEGLEGATWIEQAKLMASDGAAYDMFGGRVAIDENTIVAGAFGSAYVFTRTGTTWMEQAKLTGSDSAWGDNFGDSVAIAGETIVVGAYGDDTDNGNNSGSAYVFTRTGTTWTEQAKLTASDGTAEDRFGSSVDIDGETIVVGALGDDDNGYYSGSAYVFTLTGTTWTEQTKLTASDAAEGDFFGTSVAIAGPTVVVGAIFHDASYVFTRTGTTWTEQAKLTGNDRFGGSVAIDENTIVVGAYGDDDNGFFSGSAYVFTHTDTTWTEQAKLTASDGAGSDYFGISVAVAGDTIVVGAYYDDDNGSASGSTYVFTRTGTTWTEQTKLTASDAADGDSFGDSVAIAGETIVVGAYGDDTDNGDSSGSAYIYVLN